jgi:RsiW-degrading membrane proteinase PrsW (M82 family)
VLLWFFYSWDVNPAPGKVIWITFGLGIVIVAPVLALELTVFADFQFIDNPYLAGLAKAFWGAALPEELLKFLVVAGYCMRHKAFDERMDGMVYGAVASLGFAAMENVLYVSGADLALAVSRALTAVPCHAFLGAIMGFYVGQARFDSKNRGRYLALGLGMAIILHGLYDFPLLTIRELNVGGRKHSLGEIVLVSGLSGMSIAVLLVEGILAIQLLRRSYRWKRCYGSPPTRASVASRSCAGPPAGPTAAMPASPTWTWPTSPTNKPARSRNGSASMASPSPASATIPIRSTPTPSIAAWSSST